MLHRCVVQLAKKKGPPPRRHVLRRTLRRSGSASNAGGSAARRSGSGSNKGTSKKSKVAAAPSHAKADGNGAGSAESDPNASGIASTPADASAASLAMIAAATGSPSLASARRPSYRLATAVATVVVPPTTNVYLQGMKHLLTPANTPGSFSGNGSVLDGGAVGAATSAVPIVEEYYTSKKGPLFATAVVAGTNAVKQVSALVPFCYPTPIQRCSFTFRRRQVLQPLRPSHMPHRVVLRRRTTAPGPQPSRPEYSVLYCFCTVATENKAGVEMEALTGATMASVTLYDMLKGLPGAQEDGLSLGEAFVLAKRGGRNDFTKLLMSEPDRPLVESGVSAFPPPSGTEGSVASDATAEASNTAHAQPRPVASTTSGELSDDLGHQSSAASPGRNTLTSSAEEDMPHRIIRRSAAASADAAAAEDDLDESSTPGDAGAWWRTSKHEKRLQELYPRRKYGDGSRLVSTTPAVADPVAPARKTRETDSDPTAPAASEKQRPLSKASLIREGRPAVTTALGRVPPKPSPTPATRVEHDAPEDAGEEPAEQRRPLRGQLVKKSGRGVAPAAKATEGESDEAVDAEEEHEEEHEDDEEAEAVEDDDTERTVAQKKAKHTTPVHVAAAHRSVKAVAKKANAAVKRRYSHEDGDEEADEMVPATEDHAAEWEEEHQTSKPSRRSTSSSNASPAKRHSKTGSGSALAPAPRKQRPNSRSATAHKKGRSSAEEDEEEPVEDDATPARRANDRERREEEDETLAEDEDEAEVAAPRRGKMAKTVSGGPPSSKKKSTAMQPVRHSSWDEGTRKVRADNDADAHDEEAQAEDDEAGAQEADAEAEEDEDQASPSPPARKKSKKAVKRPGSKRR